MLFCELDGRVLCSGHVGAGVGAVLGRCRCSFCGVGGRVLGRVLFGVAWLWHPPDVAPILSRVVVCGWFIIMMLATTS